MSDIKHSIKEEILFFENKSKEYAEDVDKNTYEGSDFFRGKSEAYSCAAIRLKKVLDWYDDKPID